MESLEACLKELMLWNQVLNATSGLPQPLKKEIVERMDQLAEAACSFVKEEGKAADKK